MVYQVLTRPEVSKHMEEGGLGFCMGFGLAQGILEEVISQNYNGDTMDPVLTGIFTSYFAFLPSYPGIINRSYNGRSDGNLLSEEGKVMTAKTTINLVSNGASFGLGYVTGKTIGSLTKILF